MAKIPRGKPTSGRIWKKTQTKRFSSMKFDGTKKLKSTWDEKIKLKARRKERMENENEIKNRKISEIQEKKRLKEEREKRKLQNQFKSAQVQVLTKTHKLKSMNKKQLRQIKKTRMTKSGELEYVGLYDK